MRPSHITGSIQLADGNVDRLADWIEMEAILRGSASTEDLVQAMRIEDATGADDQGSERAQNLAEEAWIAIQKRQAWIPAACKGYPFKTHGRTLATEPNVVDSTYAFLLGLNYVPYIPSKQAQRIAKVFEELCCVAACRYLGPGAGHFAFGWPRSEDTKTFAHGVGHLCAKLAEGGGLSKRVKPKKVKDDGLDVVAWKHFPDNRPGKVILFGQCATGRRWWNKTADLNANGFQSCWFTDPLVAGVVRIFFSPETMSDEDLWMTTGYNAGVVFDRCRIAAMAGDDAGGLNASWTSWSRAYLKAS